MIEEFGAQIYKQLDFRKEAENNRRFQQNFKDNTDFFYGLVTGNGKMCARVIMEGSTWKSKNFSPEAFESEVVDLVSRNAQVAAKDFEVSEFSGAIFDIQRRHGLRSNPNFATTIVSMIVFEGIAKMLNPELDFQGEGRKFFAQNAGKGYNPGAQKTPTEAVGATAN